MKTMISMKDCKIMNEQLLLEAKKTAIRSIVYLIFARFYLDLGLFESCLKCMYRAKQEADEAIKIYNSGKEK